jgi:hypothetical protein
LVHTNSCYKSVQIDSSDGLDSRFLSGEPVRRRQEQTGVSGE